MNRKKWNIVSGFVLFFSLLLVFNVSNILNYFSFSKSEIKLKEIKSYKFNSKMKKDFIYSDNGRYYYYDDGSVVCHDFDGNEIWNKEFDEVMFSSSDSNIVVTEVHRGNIYTIDDKGEIVSSIIGLGEVSNVEVSKEGQICVSLADNKTIVFYDKNMKLKTRIVLNKGTIVDKKTNFSSNEIGVILLNELHGDTSTEINIFDTNGKILRKKVDAKDLISLSYLYNEYVLLYNNKIAFYDKDLKKVTRKSVPLRNIVYFNFKPYGFIIQNDESKNDDKSDIYLKIYNFNKNKMEINSKIDIKYDKISYEKQMYIATVDNRVDIYSKLYTLILSKKQKNNVLNATLLNEKKLLILEENALKIYEIVK